MLPESSSIKVIILLIFGYAIIPTIIIRLISIGAISRAPKGGRRIAITFDDGPDPRYTPQILDILHKYQVKACFFIVGAKARAHPEIVKQIASAGHEIGNHGFRHKIAWLLSPAATTREIRETNAAIEELTGAKARFCRPAWGLFNLFSIFYCRLKGLKVVLWTYMSWDWIKKATPESITHKVLSRIKDGAILVFHDSDTTIGAAKGGPERVVKALPMILDGIKQRGLQITPLGEIINPPKTRASFKKYLRWLWARFEWLIRKAAGIKELSDGKTCIWRVALRRYRGKEWPMPDGTTLRSGDYYMELHANNDRLMELINANTSVERMGIITMREIRNGMPAVTELLQNEKYNKVKILLGITLLHKATERLGFQLYDMRPGFMRRLVCLYEKWLLWVFHPGGGKRLKAFQNVFPKYVVMTRKELFERYPPAGSK